MQGRADRASSTARIRWPGTLDAAGFLRRYWQRRPLLMRGALPRFREPLDARALVELARCAGADARLVTRRGARWTVRHAPFARRALDALARPASTLLVQGVDRRHDAVARLLQAFRFLPYARFDDVMVSYARDGGGVGPHVDSYDVFLVQGSGRRRWRIAERFDPTEVDGAPLKLLARFVAEREMVLEPGDILYLPPGVAHDGVAIGDCTTWSIGFRAPRAEDIARAYLEAAIEAAPLDGLLSDAGRPATRSPGEIDARYLRDAARLIAPLAPRRAWLVSGLGRLLTEPSPGETFEPPERPFGEEAFARRLRARGVRLDRRTRLLYTARAAFVNGSPLAVPPRLRPAVERLADARALPARACDASIAALLYPLYVEGFLAPCAGASRGEGSVAADG